MKTNNLYVDIHILQTVPPSCVNRDDVGSPKTAFYGGATRARVSSQAWKRAMRLMFPTLFDEEQVGVRTKRIVGMVADEMVGMDREEAEKKATAVLVAAGMKIKSAEEGTDALFFMSRGQARALAALAEEGCKDKKLCDAALKTAPAVDMALFGRMVASDPSLNFDAAAQIAHSISTHAVNNEFDYFTAVDDLSPEDNAGAGHIGTVEFNSSTLYRYATVNVNELARYLGAGQTVEAVEKFAEAFACSMPTGKQNTFANRTVPDIMYVALRTDQPVNLSGAFEKPVVAKGGYLEPSVERFSAYAEKTYRNFIGAPALALAVGEGMEAIAQTMSLSDLLGALGKAVAERLGSGVE